MDVGISPIVRLWDLGLQVDCPPWGSFLGILARIYEFHKGKERQNFYDAYIDKSRREKESILLFRKSSKFTCLGVFCKCNNLFGSVKQNRDEAVGFHQYGKCKLWQKTILASLSKSRTEVNAKRKLFLSNYPSANVSIYGCNQTNIMDLTPDKMNLRY